MFTSIIDTTTGSISIEGAVLCMISALILGLVISFVYMMMGNYSKNFVITLALLPALVQAVIMMVNGNLGTSVAVLGTFGLIRFRSVPGTSREITSIFFSMAVGLACAMGQIGYAALITVTISLLMVVLSRTHFGEKSETQRHLRIAIPENLDYSGIFDDIFEKYTTKAELNKVRTINLGSMYELDYQVALKSYDMEKTMIDEIRCRNGNLSISCGKNVDTGMEL